MRDDVCVSIWLAATTSPRCLFVTVIRCKWASLLACWVVLGGFTVLASYAPSPVELNTLRRRTDLSPPQFADNTSTHNSQVEEDFRCPENIEILANNRYYCYTTTTQIIITSSPLLLLVASIIIIIIIIIMNLSALNLLNDLGRIKPLLQLQYKKQHATCK